MSLLQKIFAYTIYLIWCLAKLLIIILWKLAKLLIAIPKLIFFIFMKMKGVHVVDDYKVIDDPRLLK
jgi:hypothetical protein